MNIIKKILIFLGFIKKQKEIITFPNYEETIIPDFVFTLELNIYRKKQGLHPLFVCKDKEIIDMCYDHAEYMSKNNKTSHDNEFKRKGYLVQLYGEKSYCEECCSGNKSSQRAHLNSFLKSIKHKKALESEKVEIICPIFSKDRKQLIVFLYTKDIMSLRKKIQEGTLIEPNEYQ